MNIFKVKKALLMAGISLSCLLVSCDNEPVLKQSDPDFPTGSAGAFILNQGEYGSKIEGSLNVLYYNDNNMLEKVFSKANGRSLGSTPQCGLAYGSKVYIGVYESKTIEIIDKNTFKSIKQIRLDNSAEGKSPRGMVAKGGKVYVTLFEGYLARLDTISLTIEATVNVGHNPEVPAIMGDHIFVPNSSWIGVDGTTASKVSITPFVEQTKFDVPLNPNQFLSNGKDLFIISWGNYDDIPGMLSKVDPNGGYEVIGNARMGAIRDNDIYLVDNPWGQPVKYWKYNTLTKVKTEMEFPEVDSPSGIGVDPFRNVLIITSLPMDNGFASYLLPGFACEYTLDGKFIRKYNIGTGPACIFFNAI